MLEFTTMGRVPCSSPVRRIRAAASIALRGSTTRGPLALRRSRADEPGRSESLVEQGRELVAIELAESLGSPEILARALSADPDAVAMLTGDNQRTADAIAR